MSTLLIDELYDGVTFDQDIQISRNTNLIHVRPWIYKEGTLQDGTFTLEVYKGEILIASSTIDYEDINAEFTQNYAQGFIRFDFDSLALGVAEGNETEEFTFRFYMDNHTTDTSNFLALVRDWEDPANETYDTTSLSTTMPAGIQLYELRSR